MTKIKGTTPQNNNNSVNTSPTSSPRSQNNGAAALNTDDGQQQDDKSNILFPVEELQRLDEMINKTRWIVPVLAKQELEVLLDASIGLCKQNLDTKSEHCQRFYRESLIISFTKILTDEAVKTWKPEIHKCIYNNSMKAIELCVFKIQDDLLHLLELLSILFSPQSRFHNENAMHTSEIIIDLSEDEANVFAKPYAKQLYGWVVDFINHFGRLGGFKNLLERFTQGPKLTIQVIAALLKPWGFSYDFLTANTVRTYFLPIVDIVPKFFENLTDEDIKKECKAESKNDSISTVIKWLKLLANRIPNQDELCKNLEILRLKTILRILKFASFNGKMNALNEVNKVISNISCHSHLRTRTDDDEWLTCERMAKWIQENEVLDIVLRDCMHQPQYVEKLEKILRFLIKEKSLTLKDLDKIWESQLNKHEAIEKNVHDLLSKLAWDFTPEQLDHLFSCFEKSWTNASKKQREKLLDLIRSLSEDDKEGVMANKVLNLLWSLAHSDDASKDIIEQAIIAHIKILDYSCSQDKEAQKLKWLEKCIEQLKDNKWVITSLKHIREILQQYQEPVQNNFHINRLALNSNFFYRNDVIIRLQRDYSLIHMISTNLENYYENVRNYIKENPHITDPESFLPDGRYHHVIQIQERLNFMKYLLKEGALWLLEPQAESVWRCLAQNSIFDCDREYCFKWFSKLMHDDPDLEPDMIKKIFEDYITQLDPKLLTDSGIKCFERYFQSVNLRFERLLQKRDYSLTQSLDLIGLDYLWKIVTFANDDIAEKAILLLKEIYIHLGPNLKNEQSAIHNDFISNCMDRLRVSHDKLTVITDEDESSLHSQEIIRILRVMTVLKEYICEFDANYACERIYPPLLRAYRGKTVTLIIRIPMQNRQSEDIEVLTHTNDTIGSIRRQIYSKLKLNTQANKIDLIINNECIESSDDNKLLNEYQPKDKMGIAAKISQNGVGGSSSGNCASSSPESSSDDASDDSHNVIESPKLELEVALPSVILSRNKDYVQFLIQLAEFGYKLSNSQITDLARDLLDQLPPASHFIEKVSSFCKECCTNHDSKATKKLENLYFNCSPTECWYYLKLTYSLLVPALTFNTEETKTFQEIFIKAGGIACAMNMIVKEKFLSNADDNTKKASFHYMLKINKLALTTLCYGIFHFVVNALQNKNPNLNDSLHEHALLIQTSMQAIPNSINETTIRNIAQRLSIIFSQKLASHAKIEMSHIKRIQRIAWSIAASNTLNLIDSPFETIHSDLISNRNQETDMLNINVCREALEVLPLALCLSTGSLETLNKEKHWHQSIYDLVLLCDNRLIRQAASDQFILIALRCSSNLKSLNFFIQMLFACLQTTVKENAEKSNEYFTLLCTLLNCAFNNGVTISNTETLLNNEVSWLKKVKEAYVGSDHDLFDCPITKLEAAEEFNNIEEMLLDGHLGLTKELLLFQTAEKKYFLGSDPHGSNLINNLIRYFICPASYLYTKQQQKQILDSTTTQSNDEDFKYEKIKAICYTPLNTISAFDLIVSLCTGCIKNFKVIYEILMKFFYSDNDTMIINEWEYLPPMGPRPFNGFVGLKNAGATCYMNSVLQQLFMIKPIRDKILEIQMPVNISVEDNDDNETVANQMGTFVGPLSYSEVTNNDNNHDSGAAAGANEQTAGGDHHVKSEDEQRKEYNLCIYKHIQMIFGHLVESQMQYHVPRGFWRQFRLFGERVNLREQHDAVEFYNSILDCIDEATKSINLPQICSQVLGGIFADQKICKDCPHRYSREESFTLLSLDVKHSQRLTESLEQYVKGDLLEGANAYYCEKCDKKVDTIKRTCIKKLPSVLAIQLKRFDYDWERETAVKSNEYFEFPRELDMEPYTVSGVARSESKSSKNDVSINEDNSISSPASDELSNEPVNTNLYKLVGIVVHSGQANGGHYYSYIQHQGDDGEYRWYKFDDNDVSECKMDDEEMKNQCYGGDYSGEVYDNIMKRMAYKKQKRWWNAYILFYEKIENNNEISDKMNEISISNADHHSGSSSGNLDIKIPNYILKSVYKKNMKFLHNRMHFSLEYFQFMKRLAQCNFYLCQNDSTVPVLPETEELCFLSVKLITKFLFSIGFRVKKTLRGPVNEWYDIILSYLKYSQKIRQWFAYYLLVENQNIIPQYLLECPSSDIRAVLSRILAVLAHLSSNDPPLSLQTTVTITNDQAIQVPKQTYRNINISDAILNAALILLKRDINEQGKHLIQYFQFFNHYAIFGINECLHMIKLDIPLQLIQFSLDESSSLSSNTQSTAIARHQYCDLTKLFCIVSTLLRCYDVSSNCSSSIANTPLASSNPFSHYNEIKVVQTELIVFSNKLNEFINSRSTYIKKILEEAPNLDETIKLMKFLCWENINFSTMLLSELLWLVTYHYSYELKPHLDLLFHVIIISDSWQTKRLMLAFNGIPNDKDGLFDIISRSQNHYQKRAYQIIKMLVQLFTNCSTANELLNRDDDLKRKWKSARSWFYNEMEKQCRMYNLPTHTYFQTPQSNETSQNYYLERTHSAKITLERALKICPSEENEETNTSDNDVNQNTPGSVLNTLTTTTEVNQQNSATDNNQNTDNQTSNSPVKNHSLRQ